MPERAYGWASVQYRRDGQLMKEKL